MVRNDTEWANVVGQASAERAGAVFAQSYDKLNRAVVRF